MGPCTNTGPSSVSMTRRRSGSVHTAGSDNHKLLLTLSGFDQSAGFEHGGPGVHDRTEGHRAPGQHLSLQTSVR
jgi:hypothetical protein